MPSKADDVPTLIRNEPVLQIALARGMINAIGAARWLKEEYDLGLKEESIARHIREAEPEDIWDGWKLGEEAVKDGKVRVEDEMALMIIRRSGKVHERLTTILGNLDKRQLQVLRVEPTRRHFQLVVKADLRQAIERELGDGWIEDVHNNLVDLSVVTDDPGGEPTPALSTVLHALHERGIPVAFSTSGPAGITILVADDLRIAAHEILKELTAPEES